ncbi:hypothetical protein NFI96_025826, partial [Prochilodus magdalenae]
MGIEAVMSARTGRALSDQWADGVAVRPRTTERHITVHKRLVLGFAISILALIAVTAVAVALTVKFERCVGDPNGDGHGEANARATPGTSSATGTRTQDARTKGDGDDDTDDEDTRFPWRRARLPTALRPRHYDLALSVHMDNFTFAGRVSVDVECVNATRYVVLHADGLDVRAVALVHADGRRAGAGAVRVHRHFSYAPAQLYVIALHRELKPLRTYRLNISFQARRENELLGFFRSSYMLHGERRFLAVTQFSPTHARKAFPCFDEPIYKATFKVSLRHEASYQSLSNMPVEASTVDEDGWVTNHFSRTPRMSTYYLAWAVCNFTYREAVTESGVV